jgi:hypothetical protein
MPLLRFAAVILVIAITLRAPPAFAAHPDAPQMLSDAQVGRRLEFIEVRLRSGAGPANTWWQASYYGWTALTMGQFVVAVATTDPGLRKDMAVAVVGSSLGVIPLGLFPLPARTAASDLAAFPDATPTERRRKLAAAERLLEASAEAEALGQSWVSHVLSASVSIGFGLVLGLGYDRPSQGVFNAVSGIALSELQILTQPTAAIDDLHAYHRFTGGSKASAAKKPEVSSPMLVLRPGGIGLLGRF